MKIDLLIKNVQVYNAYIKKFIHGDVAVLNQKFLYISKTGEDYNQELTAKEVIDSHGKYMIPGLIDIHMHIESSMTTPFQFSQAVIPHGVTTVVADPHEIANVFGIDGILAMLNSTKNNVLDILYSIPSSVPSTTKLLETTGGSIEVEDVSELIKIKEICCLGEVMNFKGLINDDESLINRIIKKIKEERPMLKIEGHCPKIEGLNLAKFIYQGVDADHTQQTPVSIKEKIENGMFLEIQHKSMTQENIKYLVENNLYEHFCLVTDDVMADKLIDGHLNLLIKKAVKMGMPIEMAIYVSTYTPARRMLLDDKGSIAPGKTADFILLSDIDNFVIDKVYKNGKLEYDGEIQYKESKEGFPQEFYKSVKVDYVSQSEFEVLAPIEKGRISCRTMKVTPHTTFTIEEKHTLDVNSGKLQWQSSPYCLITVFERYGKNNNKAYGLVGGSVIKEGAIATTYAHDHHNLMVMGKNSKDMTIAVNWIIENGGGYCVVKDGKVLAGVELSVGGIISEERIDILGEKVKIVSEKMEMLGYEHDNRIMSFSTLSLPVSPSLKISDRGLIDTVKQEVVELFC
ncbi:adenine deaminase [Vallitalea sp.]|jgi:adenine deaminase|uniref:adenine deaminase n=1 Tax=Vallitalea sp. TaxID=1882829 RepID=UPI0025E9041B|nr:adenine deaminase C-terminal domain-containing protein [Vallitalea sp.]MCT4686755.1 amidohydrolase family protein [Vallitalea sp.]